MPCHPRSPGRQTRRASAPLQDIRRRRPHRQSAVGTRSRSGESRSSEQPQAVMFVVRSNTNLPSRLQHFVLPDAEGYGSDGEFKALADELAQAPIFEEAKFFSPTEIRRMLDMRFVLSLMVTMLSQYFNRDE